MQHVLPLHKSNNPPATSSANPVIPPVVPVATNEGSVPATVSPKTGTLRLAPSGLTKDGADHTANITNFSIDLFFYLFILLLFIFLLNLLPIFKVRVS